MKKVFSFIKKPWVIGLIIILGLIIFFSFRGGSATPNFETEIVSRRDLQEIVSELATAEPENNASLSFGSAGVVAEFLVDEGELVEKGQILAKLNAPAAAHRVEEARARLAAEEARLSEITSGLSLQEKIVAEQTLRSAELSYQSMKLSQELGLEEARTQRDNAMKALYSTNLTARLEEGGREDSNRSYVAPTISGTYEGDKEGVYEITLYPSHSQTGYSFRYSGLESGVGSVSTIEPQPLGKNGLYIIFPSNFAHNSNLKWVIEIPNTNSPSYVNLKNALDSAELAEKNARERSLRALAEANASLELAEAQNDLKLSGARPETIAAQIAGVTAARAGLSQAEAAYDDTIIRAPFDGIMATTSIKPGERANPGQEIVRFVGTKNNQVITYISETDIAHIDIGDNARVKFDAFRDEEFTGKVIFVSPAATSVQGVMRFKTIIELDGENPNIRAGLSADVDIYAEERSEVVAVPSRAIIRESNRNFVRVLGGESFREVQVVTGLRSSDGYTEIISGINVGDEIINYISPQELARLESLGNK